MRTVTVALSTLVLLFSLVGCYAHPSPIPMVGTRADIRQLAGDWSGEYRSDANGRSGTITFHLSAGADTAYGDVLMIPRGWPPHGSPGREGQSSSARHGPETLTIRFVRTESRTVTGTLTPYQDPDWNSEVVTRFEGRISDRVIEGTYLTRRTDYMAERSGQWKVTRTRRH